MIKSLVTVAILALATLSHATNAADVEPKIAWYGQLENGLKEAKNSNRPILLVSAAPQCQNVSGMW